MESNFFQVNFVIFKLVLMLHADTSSHHVYWMIPNANWWVHLELCHRDLDTIEGPVNAKLVWSFSTNGEVHTSASWRQPEKLRELRPLRLRVIFLSLQMNYYVFHLLFINSFMSVLNTPNIRSWPGHLNSKSYRFFFSEICNILCIFFILLQ